MSHSIRAAETAVNVRQTATAVKKVRRFNAVTESEHSNDPV